MSRRRVLLVGYGRIGQEMFVDLHGLPRVQLMVTDPRVQLPPEFVWDGRPVDVAVVAVDTPALIDDCQGSGPGGVTRTSGPGLDHAQVVAAVTEFVDVAWSVVVRSTVGLEFLDTDVYRANRELIGFWPEFYGTTPHSRRGAVPLDFVVMSDRVPEWFVQRVAGGLRQLRGTPREVIVAKLTENAFLATKVTFFHELFLLCRSLGVEFDTVRELVTADVRIGPWHSYCDEGPGWSSHCMDKDVPAFVRLGDDTRLVAAALAINAERLWPARRPAVAS